MPGPDRAEDGTPVGILTVDDRRENQIALRAMLSSPAYRIVEAGSGPEALRKLLDEEFAVLLIDVVMPEMNGFELATAIRERERTATVPIVFLTGQADDLSLVYRGYEVGAVDYLVKPLIPEMVRAKVAVFSELYRQRKRIQEQAARLVDAERREHELRILELRLAGERHYRTLAEAVPHIVWTARADGVVDYLNRRWFEYTGVPQERAAGSWESAVHPDDLAHCRDEWHDALRTGKMFQVESRLRRARDGAFRWHLLRAVPEQSIAGQTLSWLGTFTDIEDQKRAQAVLAEFKGTLDAVLDAVLIYDPDDFHFLYVNHGASVLLGYSNLELLGMRASDLFPEHDEASFRELLSPLRSGTHTVVTIETSFRRSDGKSVPVELSLQLIWTDGGKIISIARDITDRRRAQLERELLYAEAVDAIRARDEFLSVASHELRTPLSVLHLQLERLLQPLRSDPGTVLPPEQTRAQLEMAGKQVGRLSRLITELMDVSRITAGRLRLELEEVDLSAIVRDVVSRHAEESRKAECAIQLHADEPVVGKWDRLRADQVATNLLTNALKFGAGKPIDVTVDHDGPFARLTVTDHGIGIAPEDVERIFQRYEQAISSRAYGGMGLGLYIVRQIVEAHGGTIRVESQPGAGSTFTIELPREPPPARKEAPRETDAPPEPAHP